MQLKSAAPHAGRDLDAMQATAKALKERSLDMFKDALKEYQEREPLEATLWLTSELQQDPLIRSHLSILYDTLLEQNLVRVIEPYSAVELSWIASEVGQSVQVVEEKLSQMILDQVFYGVLNENVGTLEVYDEPVADVSGDIYRCPAILVLIAANVLDSAGYAQTNGRCGQGPVR